MKNYVLIALLITMGFGNAQHTEVIQQEIERNLWKPFQTAFESLDAQKLNELYADEVLRVTPNGIDTKNSFKNANLKRLNGHKKNGTRLELDFWFDSRHTNDDTSYDVGFYRMTLTNSNEVTPIYGQFHIVLKKIRGTWKIVQDWDTDQINGKEISQEDFEKQKPLQFD